MVRFLILKKINKTKTKRKETKMNNRQVRIHREDLVKTIMVKRVK